MAADNGSVVAQPADSNAAVAALAWMNSLRVSLINVSSPRKLRIRKMDSMIGSTILSLQANRFDAGQRRTKPRGGATDKRKDKARVF
jgi:hypothetical protein